MLAGLALSVALVLPAAQPDRKRAEVEQKDAELKALKANIARQQQQVQLDAVELERRNRALREAEQRQSRASSTLAELRSRRAERSRSRQQLADERARREADRDAAQEDLANELRGAYFMGHNETLKLLLNQRNPAEVGRNLTYFGYLGRLRAGQIKVISENISQIDELGRKIDAEDAKLAELETERKRQLDELDAARRERGKALVSLKEEAGGRAAELARMQSERAQLEKLVQELRRAAEAAPYDAKTPFAQLKGKLIWPVAGRIATNFGADRRGLRSDGIDIDAERGSEVRAVQEGRVIHADYQEAMGYLIVVDHGDGYWTLYGNNENLLKPKGAKVAAGEKIATVGDTGGRRRPGLYFEIRHAADAKKQEYKPMDPRGWFRTAVPPAG